jgi:hypothetical protein
MAGPLNLVHDSKYLGLPASGFPEAIEAAGASHMVPILEENRGRAPVATGLVKQRENPKIVCQNS